MKITPLHDMHAIESVSFGVEWGQALAPSVMNTLEKVYEATLKDKLPSKKPVQEISFKINSDSEGTIGTPQQMGWIFERFAPDGRVEITLALEPERLVVTFRSYTRWDQVYKIAADLMHPLLPLIAVSSGGFTVFGLQYTDVFLIEGDTSKFNANLILREGSELLPASVFKQQDLWHAHHGFFTNPPDEPARRILTVVNSDLVGEDSRLKLRLLTIHKTIFHKPLSDVELFYTDTSPLHTAMLAMHDENKTILCGLLVDSVLNQIHLSAHKGNEP